MHTKKEDALKRLHIFSEMFRTGDAWALRLDMLSDLTIFRMLEQCIQELDDLAPRSPDTCPFRRTGLTDFEKKDHTRVGDLFPSK